MQHFKQRGPLVRAMPPLFHPANLPFGDDKVRT